MLMAEWLPFLEKFGLPGLGLGLLAWVLIKAVPHVATAVVKDRENKRRHVIAMRKLDVALNDRREGREPKRLI
jgi:hypothetical protein